MRRMMMKRAASAVVLVAMLGAGFAFSTDSDPCREAYLESGLTAQQMTFDEFRGFWPHPVCERW